MKIKVKKNYLVFKVKKGAPTCKLSFIKDGEQVYCLDISLSDKGDFISYIPVKRHIGDFLDINYGGKEQFKVRQSNRIKVKKDPLRPKIHFTVKSGWNNDPNGLIYSNGKFVMFYQYNPASIEWGNMHWGRAESADLIKWKECDVALFPRSEGTIFSGSAICDERGVFPLADKPIILYYTLAGEKFSQRLAFTDEGFEKFTLYPKDVIPYFARGNRDPKIVYAKELGRYLIALYAGDDNKNTYSLFQSENLTDFTKLQDLSLSDDECPDFFPITASDGERKWVFIGANNVYLVGDIKAGKFAPCQPEKKLTFASDGYAGQTFSGLGDRVVRIEWFRWNTLRAKDFSQSMTLPRELTLKKTDGQYYLCANVVGELNEYCVGEQKYQRVLADTPLKIRVNCPTEIKISGEMPCGGELTILVGKGTFKIDFAEKLIRFADKVNPICTVGNKLDLSLIVDNCLAEVTLDGGAINFAACSQSFWGDIYIKADFSSACEIMVKRFAL